MLLGREGEAAYLELAKEGVLHFFCQGFHESSLLDLVLVIPERLAIDLAEVADFIVKGVGRKDPDRLGAVDFL